MTKQPSRDTPIRTTLRTFYASAKQHRSDFVLMFLFPLGGVLMGMGIPYFVSKILAGLIHPDQQLNLNLGLLAATSFLGIVANRFGFTAFMRLQAKTMADLNKLVFDRLMQRSVGYHINRVSGKLISDAIDFGGAFSTLMQTLGQGVTFLCTIILGLAVVFFHSWQLGLYLLIVVIVCFWWVWIESKRRKALRQKRLVATKNLTAHLSDAIVNTQTVKTFAAEAVELEKNRNLNTILRDLRMKDWQRAGRNGNNRMAALLTMQVLLIVLVTYLVRTNPTLLATGFFAFTYTLTLSNRLLELNLLMMQIDEAFLNAGPMTKMLQEDVEIRDAPNAKTLVVTTGGVDIKNAVFAYDDAKQETTIFDKLSLHIQPGEKIGLVGPSGGGKSTLTRLLLRFNDLNDGAICIDGQDIKAVTQASLRQNIAYVPQEPLLFHRSIRENIAYGKPDATNEEITHAAQQAQADTFIHDLPEGYDTIVGERGVKLSGGQRQRIAIARAILKDAPILVLDEATSALDSESEVAIQKALWELMKGRTAIVVAHRLSTIQKMDRIIVLKDGTIVESGNHKALLKENGLYAQLWAHQSGGFIEE